MKYKNGISFGEFLFIRGPAEDPEVSSGTYTADTGKTDEPAVLLSRYHSVFSTSLARFWQFCQAVDVEDVNLWVWRSISRTE